MTHYLSYILFEPLIGALLIVLISKQNENAIRWIANVTAFVGFVISIPLWFWYNPSDPGFTYDCLANSLAALRGCDQQARFDYLWIVADRSLTNSDYQVSPDKGRAVRLVKWNTDGPHPLPVSDHYGVEATLRVERKPVAKSSREVPMRLAPRS